MPEQHQGTTHGSKLCSNHLPFILPCTSWLPWSSSTTLAAVHYAGQAHPPSVSLLHPLLLQAPYARRGWGLGEISHCCFHFLSWSGYHSKTGGSLVFATRSSSFGAGTTPKLYCAIQYMLDLNTYLFLCNGSSLIGLGQATSGLDLGILSHLSLHTHCWWFPAPIIMIGSYINTSVYSMHLFKDYGLIKISL